MPPPAVALSDAKDKNQSSHMQGPGQQALLHGDHLRSSSHYSTL